MTPTLHMHAHILDVENLITSFIKELWNFGTHQSCKNRRESNTQLSAGRKRVGMRIK